MARFIRRDPVSILALARRLLLCMVSPPPSPVSNGPDAREAMASCKSLLLVPAIAYLQYPCANDRWADACCGASLFSKSDAFFFPAPEHRHTPVLLFYWLLELFYVKRRDLSFSALIVIERLARASFASCVFVCPGDLLQAKTNFELALGLNANYEKAKSWQRKVRHRRDSRCESGERDGCTARREGVVVFDGGVVLVFALGVGR